MRTSVSFLTAAKKAGVRSEVESVSNVPRALVWMEESTLETNEENDWVVTVLITGIRLSNGAKLGGRVGPS